MRNRVLVCNIVILYYCLANVESTTLADVLYQRLSKYRIGGGKNIFLEVFNQQLNKENVNRPRAEPTANPVRVLANPDQNNAGNNIENDLRQATSESPPEPITLQSIEGSSVHFLTKPQVSQPKVKSTKPPRYEAEEDEKPKINLKTVKVIKKFLDDQKENLKEIE